MLVLLVLAETGTVLMLVLAPGECWRVAFSGANTVTVSGVRSFPCSFVHAFDYEIDPQRGYEIDPQRGSKISFAACVHLRCFAAMGVHAVTVRSAC